MILMRNKAKDVKIVFYLENENISKQIKTNFACLILSLIEIMIVLMILLQKLTVHFDTIMFRKSLLKLELFEPC